MSQSCQSVSYPCGEELKYRTIPCPIWMMFRFESYTYVDSYL